THFTRGAPEPAGPAGKARPISELIAQFESGARRTPDGRPWAQLSEGEQRVIIDGSRRGYLAGGGPVLANEEATADGRSERGNFPVFKATLKQWMMRITAYAERLLTDLDV